MRQLIRQNWLRLFGLVLLGLLLWRADVNRLLTTFGEASLVLVALAIVLNVPQISIKAIRWRGLLQSMQIPYGLWSTLLVYFGSIFVGLLTPGRLGEFVKALHISKDRDVPAGKAWASVLVDRLFDLSALLIFGAAALLSLLNNPLGGVAFALSLPVVVLVTGIYVFLNNRTFGIVSAVGCRSKLMERVVFSEGGWLSELRAGIRQISVRRLIGSSILTVGAYGIFFTQCYLLVRALNLPIGFLQVSFAVALGSLVTLIPVSVSGLGTREAAIMAYLGSDGIPAESALVFSLSLFLTFYVAGGLIGSVGWWLKPAPLDNLRLLSLGKRLMTRVSGTQATIASSGPEKVPRKRAP